MSGPPARADAAPDPGSFRDPDNRVLSTRDGVFRLLSRTGLEEWRALESSRLFEEGVRSDSIIATEEVRVEEAERILGDVGKLLPVGVDGVLKHERIPFISYPYEWTYSMLRDAALLQLDLLIDALDEGLVLKDGSPYNVQWRGASPCLIDTGSFERLRAGQPWPGYRQFCELSLYPLMLEAYRGVSFRPLLRGSLEGIPPQMARALFSLRDRFRRGVFTHVLLHARLQDRYEGVTSQEVGGELRQAKFSAELIRVNAHRLRRLLSRMNYRPKWSAWSRYMDDCSYTGQEASRKQQFVQSASGRRAWDLTWDLGCNDGTYSRIAAGSSRYVVAMDSDAVIVDRLYRELSEGGERSILPLVIDLANPSPGLGWRSMERAALVDRGDPDLVLCLALVHHLSISAGVPLREIVGWLRGLGSQVVVEFPLREDPMVRRLLASKPSGVGREQYDRAIFERYLREAFDVPETLEVGTRVLYLATPP